MKTRLLLILLSTALCGLGSPLQLRAEESPQAVSAVALTPEDVRSDFAFLYRTLREAHFDLYAHRSRSDYDALYRTLLATMNEPMDATAAAILFQKFVAYGRIGHARIDAPVAAFVAYVRGGGTLIPLFLRVDDGRVVLTETADSEGRLRAGTEVLAIDDVPIDDLLERLSAYVSAERPYMAHAQMEASFPALFWIERGNLPMVTVTASVDGHIVSASVRALTLAGRAALRAKFSAPKPPVDFATREYRPLANGIAYLRPGPFFNIEQPADGVAPSYEASSFRTFIDDSFHKILASGATDLLIDLRGNPGGDNSFSDPMVAWFADRPFRFASSFMLKASAATKADYARQRAAGAPIDAGFRRQMDEEGRQPNGTRYRYDLPMVPPRAEPRFHGHVWILVDRHSYSNAASVAALVQDYGFGTILGEETADVASNYASVQHFTLPRTGIVVTYPKSHFIRPNGKDEIVGVQPDVPIGRPAVMADGDTVLDEALRIIGQAPGSARR